MMPGQAGHCAQRYEHLRIRALIFLKLFMRTYVCITAPARQTVTARALSLLTMPASMFTNGCCVFRPLLLCICLPQVDFEVLRKRFDAALEQSPEAHIRYMHNGRNACYLIACVQALCGTPRMLDVIVNHTNAATGSRFELLARSLSRWSQDFLGQFEGRASRSRSNSISSIEQIRGENAPR